MFHGEIKTKTKAKEVYRSARVLISLTTILRFRWRMCSVCMPVYANVHVCMQINRRNTLWTRGFVKGANPCVRMRLDSLSRRVVVTL